MVDDACNEKGRPNRTAAGSKQNLVCGAARLAECHPSDKAIPARGLGLSRLAGYHIAAIAFNPFRRTNHGGRTRPNHPPGDRQLPGQAQAATGPAGPFGRTPGVNARRRSRNPSPATGTRWMFRSGPCRTPWAASPTSITRICPRVVGAGLGYLEATAQGSHKLTAGLG